MADAAAPRRVTRRTFLGWWIAGLMTATVVTGLLPILVFFWPAPPKGQKKQQLTVSLDTPIDQMQDGAVTKFLAPTSPNSAFIMADGGGDNAPGDLAFGGYVVKTGGKIEVYAQNCPHLGCTYNFNQDAKTFDCPCHGSRFYLNGEVLHGPAQNPLAHLSWKEGENPSQIQVDGIVLGF
ncbi:MAG TPA: ubiquinol-cytochrome c reductase iron-sulfur subunit [Candidatus Dormibacteraeota bacterium]|nr:ubiquinol-cytochrome c reductase iron-sulfur subunit [Candidatus Dormibacteraeota bacterium]